MTSLRRFPEECRMKIGYIEYAELFDIVGKHLFPNDWNGEAEVRMGKGIQPSLGQVLDIETVKFMYGEVGEEILDDEELIWRLSEVKTEWNEEYNKPVHRFRGVFSFIHDAFADGRVSVLGFHESGETVNIAPETWRGVHAEKALMSGTAYVVDGYFDSFSTAKRGRSYFLIVPKEAIETLISERTPRRTQDRKEEIKRCEQWLFEIISKSPQAKTAIKPDLRRRYKDEHKSKISNGDFQSCWDRAIEKSNAHAWKKSGPIAKIE